MDEKVNILLVDDQQAKLLGYEAILGGLGENLIKATSGKEALEQLLHNDVAVILMDVCMPDLDGFELAAMIRKHHRFQKTAIILVSAVHMTDLDRLKGYDSGAVDYVSVPIIPEILRAKVTVFADLHRKTKQLTRLNQELEQRVAERTLELEASMVRVKESEERFRLATETMRGGIYDIDLQSNVARRSAGLVAILGYELGETVPTPEWLQERLHPEDRGRRFETLKQAAAEGATGYSLEFRVRHRDGRWIWLWDRGRLVRGEENQVVRVVGHITDIDAQKRAEEALRIADRRKDEFLATLAHELRNPLNPIRNAVELLRRKEPTGVDLEWGRDVIDRQVNHLSRLIDDLLDISRITRDKLDLRKEPVMLATVLNDALESTRPYIEQRGHELHVTMPPEPVCLEADVTRLVQVFMNLLHNAAKYTPAGGHVWLTVERPDGVEGEVVVRVKDTGIGIPAEQLPQLFEMFYQVDHADGRSEGGLGIGLTLVRRLVELHGGSVEASSAGLHQGSEMVVRLPVQSPETLAVTSETPAVTKAKPPAPRRILIAEDNPDSAESLAMLLGLYGHEVRVTYNGADAVSAVESFRPEVALLDLGMPKLNGYDAARQIREQPHGRHVALIALTGWSHDRDRQRTREAGFDAHLVKPVDHATLMKLLAELPGHVPVATAAAEPAAEL